MIPGRFGPSLQMGFFLSSSNVGADPQSFGAAVLLKPPDFDGQPCLGRIQLPVRRLCWRVACIKHCARFRPVRDCTSLNFRQVLIKKYMFESAAR